MTVPSPGKAAQARLTSLFAAVLELRQLSKTEKVSRHAEQALEPQ